MEGRFKKTVRLAGLPGRTSPHTLRRSIAVRYLINGAPISFVQRLLGHESLATTGIYTQLADQVTKEDCHQTADSAGRGPVGPGSCRERATASIRGRSRGVGGPGARVLVTLPALVISAVKASGEKDGSVGEPTAERNRRLSARQQLSQWRSVADWRVCRIARGVGERLIIEECH